MAIIKESKGNGLVKTYSDAGYYIHGGNPEGDYAMAIDPESATRTYTETTRKTYTETTRKIETKETEDTTKEKAKAYDILMGEAVINE